MTPEQINELKDSLENVKRSISDIETMLLDYAACASEISKKYLSAAIKKQVSGLPAYLHVPTD